MGDIKNGKRRQTKFIYIIMKAVYCIGFGMLALTLCILIFLNIIAEEKFFKADVFVNIEMAIMIVYPCVAVFLIFIISSVTAKKLKKKGQVILEVTNKIKMQDLDFDINSSGVKEIDQVLESIDDVRIALKEALETQWQLEKNRKYQISALAHDFKTPITVLKGNIDLLHTGNLDDLDKEYVKDAKISLEQLEIYLTQLLQITQVDRGFTVNKQKVNLKVVLDEVVARLSRITGEKEIAIFTEKADENISISADVELIKRVFNNLITNALDFTPKEGTIRIVLTSDKNNAVICITDSGCGFSQNALKHAKEQFYMEGISRGRMNHYGLGLYIADSIIKQHNGTLQLTNDEVNGGAKVIIHIPQCIE